MTWPQQRYRLPPLSAILHNDESHQLLHLVLLPVRGGKLVDSELLGNRATMKAMQKDFHEQVRVVHVSFPLKEVHCLRVEFGFL